MRSIYRTKGTKRRQMKNRERENTSWMRLRNSRRRRKG